MKKFVVCDIGGTSIKYGIVNELGSFLSKSSIRTQSELGGPFIIETIKKIVHETIQIHNISGICLSSAGMIDPEKGEVFFSGPTIPNFKGTAFKRVLEKEFSIPCEVENDVNCAGLCEVISGSGKNSQSTLCLTIGTGIGGSFFQKEKLYNGYSFSACEIGYMHLRNSNFQKLASTTSLVENVSKRKGESVTNWNGEKIFSLAKENDKVCKESIEEMCEFLGEGISNLCYAFNPETVVLGGGIMSQKSYLEPIIRKSLEKYLFEVVLNKTKITFATYENSAGMLGAFYHFKQRQPIMFKEV
ncbi:ROK family protein [Enterococcus italicus]|uniref:ROK family protein n=1 Tax=Enterococcus italicus (strain DSM 15952 / CCUG 50447 / LMG 22039 / TP 1.5) TaxID=888064 RepID=E6LG92_ENTI1|nr:ROK family protein [Enterococcus italicus]EFU73779.1 ROK family protein [Enterococcus italicus DSM 15952]OJG56682.1 hypothetical protein RT43_GL001563 [Enterococcus italicus DSM 15952]